MKKTVKLGFIEQARKRFEPILGPLREGAPAKRVGESA
jgi:hypothetical protein